MDQGVNLLKLLFIFIIVNIPYRIIHAINEWVKMGNIIAVHVTGLLIK